MIITKLHCGLGNQMFQYAAGLALANKHRTIQKLDVSWFRFYEGMSEHNQYGLHCFNIIEQFATREEVSELCSVRMGRWDRMMGHFFKGPTNKPDSWHVAPRIDHYSSFAELSDQTYLDGYFQSEKFFLPVQEVLRSHFTFRLPPSSKVSRMAELIRSSSPSVFLHVRRGDYVTLYQNKFGALNQDYYQQAIRQLQERYSGLTVFIFSDDIDAVEREFQLDLPHHFVKATEHYNFYDKIRLMSLCDHAIISNSTFAWWGAWLINSNQKVVIAPKPWFVLENLSELEIVPESWNQVGRLLLAG